MNERNKYLSIVKDFVLEFLEGEDVKIFLFGSRARLDHNNRSDIDIGLLPKSNFDDRKITLLKEKIEELNVPYKVEIVDFRQAEETFKKQALKDAEIWKD